MEIPHPRILLAASRIALFVRITVHGTQTAKALLMNAYHHPRSWLKAVESDLRIAVLADGLEQLNHFTLRQWANWLTAAKAILKQFKKHLPK